MDDNAAKRLCEAIIDQAVEDYRYLQKRGIGYFASEPSGTYSITELEHFFRSKWCGKITNCLHRGVDGTSILRKLKAENK